MKGTSSTSTFRLRVYLSAQALEAGACCVIRCVINYMQQLINFNRPPPTFLTPPHLASLSLRYQSKWGMFVVFKRSLQGPEVLNISSWRNAEERSGVTVNLSSSFKFSRQDTKHSNTVFPVHSFSVSPLILCRLYLSWRASCVFLLSVGYTSIFFVTCLSNKPPI